MQQLQFSHWPLRDDGLLGWLYAAVCLVAPVLVWSLTRSPWVAAVVFAVLNLSAWRLWLPVHYDLGPKGIQQTVLGRTRRLHWNQIGRYDARQRGVVLYARNDTGPLSPLSAVYLRWGGRREALLALLEFYLTPRSPRGSSVVQPPEPD